MNIIPPIAITDAMLTSSIAEPDTGETVYNGASTYALGAEVIETTYHRKYESLQAGNIGHALPDYSAGEKETAWWLDIGASNKWAMFDLFSNQQSEEVTSPLTITINPSQRFGAIALVGLDATSATVTVKLSGVTKYTVTVDLLDRDVYDAYTYCFAPFDYKTKIAYFVLPPYSTGTIDISIAKTSGTVKCSGLILGMPINIGRAQYKARVDSDDYSLMERDEFGNVTLVPRKSVPTISQQVEADANRSRYLEKLKDTYKATPIFWSSLDDITQAYFAPLAMLGIFRNWSIDVSEQDFCMQQLELEEI